MHHEYHHLISEILLTSLNIAKNAFGMTLKMFKKLKKMYDVRTLTALSDVTSISVPWRNVTSLMRRRKNADNSKSGFLLK